MLFQNPKLILATQTKTSLIILFSASLNLLIVIESEYLYTKWRHDREST